MICLRWLSLLIYVVVEKCVFMWIVTVSCACISYSRLKLPNFVSLSSWCDVVVNRNYLFVMVLKTMHDMRLIVAAGARTDFQKLDALEGFDGNQSLA